MTTTPRQAAEFRRREFAQDAARLTAIVEVAIREDKDEHWIDIRSFKIGAVIDVRDEYRRAGWSAEIVHDQRDGDALVVKAAP
jgi:hypothetical protein